MVRKQTLYKDEAGRFYRERNVTQEDGSNKKEFVETTVLTDQFNEDNILTNVDDLTMFVKSGEIYTADDKYYLKVTDGVTPKYVDLHTEEIISVESPTKVPIEGPLYRLDGQVYEYYEPNLIYNSKRVQYKETEFLVTFRQVHILICLERI